MPNVADNIRTWLHRQEGWLQRAAEILLTKGRVVEPDLDDLVALIKTPEGRRITSNRAFEGLSRQISAAELRLVEIGGVCGIENLSPRNPLSFGNGNLCVIYGHNGSGKSGYSRILQKSAGKAKAKDLRPNIFQVAPATRKCNIGYLLNGVPNQVEWLANDTPIDTLKPIDIFDSETATSYLTEETAASYLPPSVALFEELVRVCSRVKTKLEAEQRTLANTLPSLPSQYYSTPSALAYRSLSPKTSEGMIQSMINWAAEDEERLDSLIERLKAEDPLALSRTKRNTKAQVEQLVSLIKRSASSFSDESVAEIRGLRDNAQTKRRIASESGTVISTRLDGVGTDTWRALWEAARSYSQTVAYPDRGYPVTENARCVLCHQELAQDAQERLKGFENFIEGELEADASEAEAVYQRALQALPQPLAKEQVETLCQAAGLHCDDWIDYLSNYWSQIGSTRSAILNGEFQQTATPVPIPLESIKTLEEFSRSLEHQAVQHEADARSFDREGAQTEQLNLEAKRWISQQESVIREEVSRLRQVDAYDQCIRSTNSQAISRKAGEISEQAISQEFVSRFNRELNALGASRIKVELNRVRTTKGRSLHKLQLRGAKTDKNLPEAILSEGERRIVALAAFLADVAEQPLAAPFIFDDPISSLDHDFENHVASRLAQLAKTRQVIVFTHRLSLYGAMEDAAKKIGEDWKKSNLHQHCIESFSGSSGHPVDQAVWNANTTKANNLLIERLNVAKKAGETSGAEAYRNLAQGICSDFRKLLERTVEDDLLNQVVRRHRRSVTTENRLTSLPLIEPDDCKLFDDLMTKFSCYEHSQSSEVPVSLPEEDELRSDLQALKAWREAFKQRQKEGLKHV